MKGFLFATAALLLAAAANAATISGTVTNDQSQPMAAMTVAAYTTAGALQSSGSTTATGSYALTLPAGSYHVLAYDPAGAFATSFHADAESFDTSATLALTSTESAANIDFRLVPAGFAVGHVTSPAGEPLSKITVAAYNLSGTRRGFTSTDAAGRFTLALPPGSFKIAAYDEALTYATTFFDGATSFDTAATLSIAAAATATTDLQLLLAAKLTGRVVDRVSGAPLAGITATAYNADGTTRSFATTDAEGAYSIVVPPGDYRLGTFDPALVHLPQFYPDQSSFASAAVVAAVSQQTAGGFDFALKRGARVAGHVSSRSLGGPLEAITVGAFDPGGRTIASTNTDASGSNTILLAPATVKLIAFDGALQFATAYYLDAPTFDAEQSLSLVEGQSLMADFAMADAGRIRGIVRAATTLTPLPSIDVIVYDTSFRVIAETTTDAAGSFRVAVPSGSYFVAAADAAHRYAAAFYGGGSGAAVDVAARQDVGPLQIPLAAAPVPPRRRAVRN